MARLIAGLIVGLLAASLGGEDPASAIARGKLEADLGHPAVAAEAFASVARATQATAAQRWEALVRLAVARRDAGEAKASAAAFEEAYRGYGKDPDALRFLILAAGGAVPGQERWEEMWRQVTLDVDRRDPERPRVRVRWPGVAAGLCPCNGSPVDLDFKDGDYSDIFRLFADLSGLNVVVQPLTQGHVTYRVAHRPWDEALEQLLAPNGLVARLEGNVLWIGRPEEAGERRSFTGRATSFEYVDKDLVDALQEIAANGGVRLDVPPAVQGRVTFKLDAVPWDQALDLLLRANGLTWTRTADVIHVRVRQRSRRLG
jgi:hypothetical protein